MICKVIIPMFNHGDMTEKCIQETKKNAGIPVDIVVIDDGSKEPFVSTDATTIRLESNSGFTKAVNAGLRALGLNYDYVCILNNDTIPQKDFLKILVQDMENDPSIGIASSGRVENREDEDFRMHTTGADLTTGEVYVIKEKDSNEIQQAIFVPFTCVVLSKKLVEDVGLLDERMRNHCSDNDMCIRAVLNNFAVILDTASRVVHAQSVTVNEHKILPYEDQRVFAAKHFGVMMNEILGMLPVNKQLNKWGELGFKYEVREEEKPLIEISKS